MRKRGWEEMVLWGKSGTPFAEHFVKQLTANELSHQLTQAWELEFSQLSKIPRVFFLANKEFGKTINIHFIYSCNFFIKSSIFSKQTINKFLIIIISVLRFIMLILVLISRVFGSKNKKLSSVLNFQQFLKKKNISKEP